MPGMSIETMRQYLSRSISSFNTNKLNGLLAEVDFRAYLREQGFGDRVSVGGWLARSVGGGNFGATTIALFPLVIPPGEELGGQPETPAGLHTVGASLHSIGIRTYFCSPVVGRENDARSIEWQTRQLGLPAAQPWERFPGAATQGFNARARAYKFLRYRTSVEAIPEYVVPEEFTKEHLRVTMQDAVMQELSDIDGILWGQQYTYPIEIKEKTPAHDNKLGDYFGLDLGPFVKLAFYAARRGNLKSLFIVREIDAVETRRLVDWWFITFDQLAQWASWQPQGGGTSMSGFASTVVKIPKDRFARLDRQALDAL